MITTRLSHARSIAASTAERDKNGNIASNDASQDITYTFNWGNKLRKALWNTSPEDSIEIKYDPFGNRVYKKSTAAGSATEHKYIVDITGDLPVILMELNGSGDIVKTYVYANSEVIAQHDGDNEDEIYFYIHDRLGSVRLLIDDQGVVKNTYTYEPFGEMLATECTETTENPFKFTGQWFDAEIEEYYLRARQYNPQIARFTSRDPVTGKMQRPLSLHKYLYCGNDPPNCTDPSGKTAWNLVSPIITGHVLHNQAINLASYGATSLDFRFFDLAGFTEQFIPYAIGMSTALSFTPLWFQAVGSGASLFTDETGIGATGLLMDGWTGVAYTCGFLMISEELGVNSTDISDYVDWRGGYFSEVPWKW